MLNVRNIAVQGLGAAVLSLALQGLVPASSPPISPPSGGGGFVRPAPKPVQFPATIELAQVGAKARAGGVIATTGREVAQALASGRLSAFAGDVSVTAYANINQRLAISGAAARASAGLLGTELGIPGSASPDRAKLIATAGAVSAAGDEGWNLEMVAALMALMR